MCGTWWIQYIRMSHSKCANNYSHMLQHSQKSWSTDSSTMNPLLCSFQKISWAILIMQLNGEMPKITIIPTQIGANTTIDYSHTCTYVGGSQILAATNSHCLLWCRCLSKVVKFNIEPLVDFFMDGSVLGTKFLGCHSFLESLHKLYKLPLHNAKVHDWQ